MNNPNSGYGGMSLGVILNSDTAMCLWRLKILCTQIFSHKQTTNPKRKVQKGSLKQRK